MNTLTTTIHKSNWIDNLLKYDAEKSFSYDGADAIFDNLVDAENMEIDIKNLTITDIKIIFTEYDRIEDIINDYDLLNITNTFWDNIDMSNDVLLDWFIHQGFYNSGFRTPKPVTDEILIELNDILINNSWSYAEIIKTFDYDSERLTNKFIVADWSNH